MSDTSSLLPPSVIRNLSDKLYEKRKNAALEVESIIRQLTTSGDHERISAVINLLTNDFTFSPQANHRKGGLIGLAAATVGLAGEAAQHLQHIVPPVLKSLTDQDNRVRYYACEALYNIAKVARGDFIMFFNQIFDALCKLSADSDTSVQSATHLLDRLVKDIVTESDQFSIEEFIPLLRERMNVLNPYVRQFLVGWITVLDSVPDIDMLGFLPDFLDGLFNMLSDSSHEIRQQADAALSEFLLEIKNSPSVDYGRMAQILVQRAGSSDEFTRQTAITWINEFVKLGREQLVPYYANILGSILPCISDKEEKIRLVAKETNENLHAISAETDSFNVEDMLHVARRELESNNVETRLEALRWILILLEKHRTERENKRCIEQVLSYLESFFMPLLDSLVDTSDEVVLLLLDIFACIAHDEQHFRPLMESLVDRFHNDRVLLEQKGTLIIRRLCVLLDAQHIYEVLAAILVGGTDLEFLTTMVQALNLILLTASELANLRRILKQSCTDSDSKKLFFDLYATWCYSPMAAISLCLLGQAYQHATLVIQSLEEEDINVKFLVQIDKLVRLLETPVFTYLRLQLLDPSRCSPLLKALNGLLMLLPQQSMAFKILRTRLKTVPAYALMHVSSNSTPDFPGLLVRRTASGDNYPQLSSHPQITDGSSDLTNGDFQSKRQYFLNEHWDRQQNQNWEHRTSQQIRKSRKGHMESAEGGDHDGSDFTEGSSKSVPPRIGWRSG